MQNSTSHNIQWIQLAATALGGGAMGAIITAVVTKWRNRQQPVGYDFETIDVIKQNPDFPSLQAMIMMGNNSGPGLAINNLSMTRITIVNKGNVDIPELRFGLTLTGTNQAVDIKVDTPDRHHVLEVLTPVSLMDRKQELDFVARPFNRKKPYTISLNYTYRDEPGTITLGSDQPIRFVESGATVALAKQIALQAMKEYAFGGGGPKFQIRIR